MFTSAQNDRDVSMQEHFACGTIHLRDRGSQNIRTGTHRFGTSVTPPHWYQLLIYRFQILSCLRIRNNKGQEEWHYDAKNINKTHCNSAEKWRNVTSMFLSGRCISWSAPRTCINSWMTIPCKREGDTNPDGYILRTQVDGRKAI